MVIQVEKVKFKRQNLFMSNEEAKILWDYSKRWGTKWQVIVGFGLFRGMRISEICAINLYDFQTESFNKLNVILSKSYISDDFPLMGEFAALVKEYVLKNRHRFTDGYLFPYHSSRRHASHMQSKCAIAMFAKMRQIIGKDHPAFLERREYASGAYRYRIGWHSCRRWFETRIWDKYKDKMQLRDIMRYKKSETVDVYINPYEVWKKEGEILENTFGDLLQDFNKVSKGQTKLTSFISE